MVYIPKLPGVVAGEPRCGVSFDVKLRPPTIFNFLWGQRLIRSVRIEFLLV